MLSSTLSQSVPFQSLVSISICWHLEMFGGGDGFSLVCLNFSQRGGNPRGHNFHRVFCMHHRQTSEFIQDLTKSCDTPHNVSVFICYFVHIPWSKHGFYRVDLWDISRLEIVLSRSCRMGQLLATLNEGKIQFVFMNSNGIHGNVYCCYMNLTRVAYLMSANFPPVTSEWQTRQAVKHSIMRSRKRRSPTASHNTQNVNIRKKTLNPC